jgi:hypothetical protein
MKKMLLSLLGIALVCSFAGVADAAINHNGKYALHIAGPHDEKGNTCDYVMTNCAAEMVTSGASGIRYDVYALAVDVNGIAGARFGLGCETTPIGGVGFFFYGWTACSDFEIPTAGWPGCGEGNALTWIGEQAGPNVTMGILDVYVYPGIAKLCTDVDARVGFAEMCDGSQPTPLCNSTTSPAAFGCVGFDRLGYNPCGEVPVEERSWGAVKSLYR